ncbi:M56 family metallopeptidase [uncultured Bacteroides sp.]|uniref:M56 family metallopeptidase n=1 Tax=uncultured Bacteroides sp. TaxID=162156 RepID=UPI002AA60017|nr:M56 family metallopeptidase [uncultured Bacteroides sp.]
MNPDLTYLLKANVALALFYVFYRTFFDKDTFFYWRRLVLVCFLLVSALYPILNMQEWIKGHEPMVVMADIYATIMMPEVTIGVQPQAAIDWPNLILSTLGYIYWGGFILLSIRFLVQLFSILQLVIHCRKVRIKGVRVYLLDNPSGPFSFFRWIFIHTNSHTDNELEEILIHEQAHSRQWHSVDVILSELVSIICWFNPFAWLMQREIRCNLEYLADNHVLESGHDSRSYQYHLLGLIHQTKAAATLYNSFNVLPLKKRIKMMNRRRTKAIGRTKYLLFIPLTILLMIISNIELVARTARHFTKEMMPAASLTQENPSFSAEVGKQKEVPLKRDVATAMQIINQKDSLKKDSEESPVFMVVEQMPEYPGGQKALMTFLSQNIKYPAIAKDRKIQGRVIAQFVVDKDGSVSEPHVIRSISPELDTEALRVIAMMPKWKPGRQKGQEVRVKYTLPINFNLNTEKADKLISYTPARVGTTNQNVYQVVEKMPEFPGGQEALMHYLARNIRYPIDAQKAKEEGRVIIQIIIDEKGNVTSPNVVRKISPSLDAEAIRVVSDMPKWEPGKQDGQAVRVKYTIPIAFKLSAPTSENKAVN